MKKILLINVFLILYLGFITNLVLAQNNNGSIDAAGDVAFVAYATPSSNGCAGFAVVLLDDCPNSTSIAFSDDEWTGTSFLPLAEGEVIWTNNTGATLDKGTVIKIFGGNNAWGSATVNIGSLNITNTANLTTSGGDQLFAFTGSSRGTVGTLLAFTGGILTSTLVFQGTPFGSGGNPTSNLVFNGNYGVNVTSAMGGVLYTGLTVCNGTTAACNTMINTQSSWTRPTGFTSLTTSTAFFAAISSNFTGSALPIELTRFEGKNQGAYNLLTWQTASESQNKGFDIERSADGVRFDKIGFVAGNSTTNTKQDYRFEDSSPLERSGEVVYYRLKQTDYDGTFEYSHILTVKNNAKQERFVLSPNPVSEVLNVEYLGKNNNTRTIAIYDILGNLIFEINNDLQENEINTSSLQSGTYILKINQNGVIQTEKFMKI